jgi:hypothetical protein
MDNVTSLKGPVETIDGKLVLFIPLEAGGSALLPFAKGIAVVDGDDLKVTIPEWLAPKLGIKDGSQVQVDNQDGKFKIRLADANE